MNARDIIIVVVVAIIMLAGGVFLGMWYGGMQSGSTGAPAVTQTNSTLVKSLSSQVVPSIPAYGQVSKIEGSNLTLTYKNDSIVVPVTTDARIYAFVTTTVPGKNGAQPTTTTSSKQVSFSDIKTGDNVSVNMRVLASGQLQGFSVSILPATTAK